MFYRLLEDPNILDNSPSLYTATYIAPLLKISYPESPQRNDRPQGQRRRNNPRDNDSYRDGRNNPRDGNGGGDRRYSNDRRNNDRRGGGNSDGRRNNALYKCVADFCISQL